MQKQQTLKSKRPDTIPHGRWRAAASTVGLLAPDVTHVLDDFASFSSTEARAAFADKWISLVARRFEETWQVFYQLLKLVETERLYASSAALDGQGTYPTFQAYWEAKTGKSFDDWLALEQTYTYCCAFKPAMIDSLYATAHKAAVAQQNQAADKENQQANPHGGDRKSATCQEQIKLDTNKKDVKLDLWDGGGNTNTYALRRLAKKRPDLHAQCLAGELTANAAMVQAGFRTRPPSRKLTPLDRLLRDWRRLSVEEQAYFVREKLSKEEREALINELVGMGAYTTAD